MAALAERKKRRPSGGIFATVVLLLLAVAALGGPRAVAEELPHGERQPRLLYVAYAEEYGKVRLEGLVDRPGPRMDGWMDGCSS